ncbi:C6 zinc finger domain protein [Halenospora varia]|nr:C6 zinc finger domain protein [Halenospora varia]
MTGDIDRLGKARPRRHTVKSGCRTCKSRKVKCDEGRPACYRCVSSGRNCDGYGIWGGGGNVHGPQQRSQGLQDNPRDHSIHLPVSIIPSGAEERLGFEWFKCRTATKLPGSFISGFWTTLVFQASFSEPAILHAILALSSIHRNSSTNVENGVEKRNNIPLDENEHFALRSYVKAISYLQPHFSTTNRASLRVALITCVVFIYLELLRGHFQTAQIHFHSGLRILEEMEFLSRETDGILRLNPCRQSADDWILEAFSRLHLQIELFKHSFQHPYIALQLAEPRTPYLSFHSINEVWQGIERLLNKVFHLTHQRRRKLELLQDSRELIDQQECVRVELARWLAIFEGFRKGREGHASTDEKKCYQLLSTYHTMTSIMADTCLWPSDELAYDLHTNKFVLLIDQLATLWRTTSMSTSFRSPPTHIMDMPKSIIDMGWVPPLFYAAVRCRVHRVRTQAARLLECTSHREGIWDSRIALCIARKVIEVEERDFYETFDTNDDFPLTGTPSLSELLLPELPGAYRIQELEVILSGSPMDKILLFGKQKQNGTNIKKLISQYDAYSQRWTDELWE